MALGGELEIGKSVLKSDPNIDTQPDGLISRNVTMTVSTSLVNGDRYTRGIWKVMHMDPYNCTQWSEKKDEGINVNVRIWGFWGYHILMFALMR